MHCRHSQPLSSSDATDRSIDILLVEDNPGDVRLTREAFEAGNMAVTLHASSTAREAKGYLESNRPLPDIVLLDLNLPGMNGVDFLHWLRDDPTLGSLPVIMLTSSASADDVSTCYGTGANAYVTKPMDHDEFVAIAEAIERFWLQRAKLPCITQ